MTSYCRSTPIGGRRPRLWVSHLVCVGWLASLGLASQPAQAEEPGFYSGGTFHPLIVSETEFAVELAPAVDRSVAAQRMRAGTFGVLQDVPWGERGGRFAILRTDLPEAAARLRTQTPVEFVSVHPVYRQSVAGQPILSSGQLVVCFRSDVSADERGQILEDYEVDLIAPVAGLDHTYVVVPRGDVFETELATANGLHRDPRTVYAHPDFRMPVVKHQFTSDTFYDQQWYLENFGAGNAVSDADIDIVEAYNRTFGNGVLIGQLDDACDVNHEDLVANYSGISHNITDNTQSATAANPQAAGDRHGTATMGIMVADVFNVVGIRGIAPSARFTASRGLDSFPTTSQIASAYTFARNQSVDVHNNSWGFGAGTTNPQVIVDALRTAFDEGRDGLGMVLCFAAGSGAGMGDNPAAGVEVEDGDELATLPTVIGVGASNARDEVCSYSNFGRQIDVLAPSGDSTAGVVLPSIVTTDNTDSVFPDYPGYNDNGFADNDVPNLADPQYTDNFSGTSASSAIVSGVAALILALEPEYTAVQVRNVIEHTCDKINSAEAGYHGTTGRSLRYGYGRVNAGAAIEATHDGFYWPERVADVDVDPAENTIRWKINDDLRELGAEVFGVETVSVLVVESDAPFEWAPTDQESYSVGEVVAPGVTVAANLLAEVYTYAPATTTKYFGIYTVATTPKRGFTYGFGVAVSSDGTVIDSGETLPGDGGSAPDERCDEMKPNLTIQVSPLSGDAPLKVNLRGNANTALSNTTFQWDFGDGTTSDNRVVDHTYASAGTYRATLTATVTLEDGTQCPSQQSVNILVTAPGGDGGDGEETGTVKIRISDPNSTTSDISAGFAPLPVVLTAEVSGLGTTPSDLAVFWDLGDGNSADSLSVAHTYRVAGVFPIVVTVTSETAATTLRSQRYITVLESTASPSPTPTATPDGGDGDGNGGLACGAGAMMSFWALALLGLRRRLLRDR